ncbi:MAG: mandelate racemase/muconate lactonizing enzyme family protein, partial [bacterium]|nr:mandelate racemase/muconate lactonizing enzyme family protein [bacterium]
MKITQLSTAVVESNFDWTFIKIETDAGVTGYGEAYFGPGLPAVIREYGRMLVGRDPTSIDRLVREMKGASVHVAPGLVCHAISGIETALLDVTGKYFKLPVWQLLGGKYRDAVTIYADCHAGEALESIDPLLAPRTPHWQESSEDSGEELSAKHRWDSKGTGHLTPESYAKQATEMAARGFRMLKFDIDVPSPYDTDDWNRDLSGPEIDYSASLVAAAREAVGPDIGLAIDCHWNYGVQAAVELARAVEPYNLLWFEDPVPPENIRALADVQRATRVAVATGENHYQRIDFERLITEAGLRLL